jgi:hypothetical protein
LNVFFHIQIVFCLVVLVAVISGHDGPPGHNHTLTDEAHPVASLLGAQQQEKAVLPVNSATPAVAGSDGRPKRQYPFSVDSIQ